LAQIEVEKRVLEMARTPRDQLKIQSFWNGSAKGTSFDMHRSGSASHCVLISPADRFNATNYDLANGHWIYPSSKWSITETDRSFYGDTGCANRCDSDFCDRLPRTNHRICGACLDVSERFPK